MLEVFSNVYWFNDIINGIARNDFPILISGIGDIAKILISSAISNKFNKRIIFITNQRQKDEYIRRFSNIYDKVFSLQERDNVVIPFKSKSKQSDIKRLEDLINIKQGFDVLVLTPQNIIEKFASIDIKKIEINTSDVIDIDNLVETLFSFGYDHVKTIYEKGQFSKRGGIIDIFPPKSDYPIRIEFFGDEVESIKLFDVETQKSFEKINSVVIYQATEWLFLEKDKEIALNEIEKDYKKVFEKLNKEYRKNLEETFGSIINKNADRYEPLFPYFYSSFYNILDFFYDDLIIVDDYTKIVDQLEGIEENFEETFKDLLEKGYVLPKQSQVYFDTNYIKEKISSRAVILTTFIQGLKGLRPRQIISTDIKESASYNANKELLLEEVKFLYKKGYSVNIFTGTKTAKEELATFLQEKDLPINESQYVTTQEGIYLIDKNIEKGIEIPSINFALLSFINVNIPKKELKKQVKRKKDVFYTIEDLTVGSLVVHQTYGIGKFIGFEKVEVEGVSKEYLKLEYANHSFLYVPTTNLDMVEKYIGSDGAEPKLSKLNSLEWQKQKQKVRKSLEIIAKDLVELYAKRQLQKGYKFSSDTVWQKEFEEKFPYQETEGQLRAIEDIKKDMESSKPMDRILCGDVGYGKTEVALRACFKACMDSKQVAFLVPTTILAHQHYINFVERLKNYPITVEVLSRFKSESEQKKIIKNISNGTIDIIIGTHRLLSKDVKFKDLGLLIIDEEHKFGVEHKERIKKLKENVDVLTLTATPIPRTLNMAMLGIKDLSVIEEPPEDRFPIQTFVMEYNEKVIKEAILREIERGGQIFYLYNRVSDIENVVAKLNKLLDNQVNIAYAHGQMDEKILEEVLIDFMNGKYDVLVCTTIIESGVDIPTVNTLIVEDADRLGLAQLYQIRGRVGRSNKLAFAYLTFRKDKVLSEEAQKRLSAIKEFTELGSGFKIAMRDLEIRGAGSILGKVQHGHINSVGYDMYIRLLSEEIKKLKGEKVESEIVPTIDLMISAFIPPEYIEDHKERINMYKKISSINDKGDMEEIYDELIDRFSDIPIEVDNLIKIAYLKRLFQKIGVISLIQRGQNIKLQAIDRPTILKIFDFVKGQLKAEFQEDCIMLKDMPQVIVNKLIEMIENVSFEIA